VITVKKLQTTVMILKITVSDDSVPESGHIRSDDSDDTPLQARMNALRNNTGMTCPNIIIITENYYT
jgi:hypothetical protein